MNDLVDQGLSGTCGRAALRRSDLAPLPAESWVMPGSAAETRADTCRSSGAATLPVQVPLRYWFVGGSAVSVSGFGPGFSSPSSLLVTSASTGPGGSPVGGATVVVRAGRAPASLWPALLACPSPLSRLGGRAWRRPASRRAGQDRPAVATTACVPVAALLASLLGHHLHLPPPLIGLLCCSPISGPVKRAGPVERLARAPTRPYCPTCHRSAQATPRTSASTRTDLTDLTRLSLHPSTWRVPVGGCRLGCAVRRPVVGLARG